MPISSVPRICLVGECAGVGKSLIVAGIIESLKSRGLSVACCVTGKAQAQGVIYSRMTRRHVRSVDPELLSPVEVRNTLGQVGIGADIIIIDGDAGLFDGASFGEQVGSDADFLSIVNTPALFVIEANQLATSLMAKLSGFASFGAAHQLDACVVNQPRIGDTNRSQFDPTLYSLFSRELEAQELPPCIGYVPHCSLSGRLPASDCRQGGVSITVPLQLLKELRELIEGYIDLDKLLEIASKAPALEYEDIPKIVSFGQCRIAVANDSCFGFCYQDNLDLLRLFGAELISFSPLIDRQLPQNIGGIYIPGGCLGEYADTLEANKSLYSSIREFILQGGVLYSEGAGSAFLCNEFFPSNSERFYSGVGIIDCQAREIASGAKYYSSFSSLSLIEDGVLGEIGNRSRALVVNDWVYIDGRVDPGLAKLTKTMRFEGADSPSFYEGYSVSANSCSTLNFLNFSCNPTFAAALCQSAAAHQLRCSAE